MILQARLRDGKDDDIIAWYEAQEDRSEAVRRAIRAYIRFQNGETQEAIVKAAVSGELARLPDLVAGAVRDALAAYSLTINGTEATTGVDPELAARFDATLDAFFE